MSTPYEILAAPFTAYLASANTAEPTDLTSTSGYTLIGTNGNANYDEDGVHLKHADKQSDFRGLGKTGVLKTWRQEEDLSVEFTVYDMTVENYAKALNNLAVTTIGASGGVTAAKSTPMLQGYDVALFALLLRSSYNALGDSFVTQYWIPVVAQAATPEPVFKKGEPAGLKFEFKALQDLTNGFGKYRIQTA